MPRNIVARSQFLVASLYNVNDAAHSIGASHIYCFHGATKFTKTCEIPQNSLEILSNTCRYNIFETYLGYWDCLIAINLKIYLKNFIATTNEQHPKPTRHKLCCIKLGTSHDVKSFAIGSFLECFIVRISAQSDQFQAKFVQKIPTKSTIFY